MVFTPLFYSTNCAYDWIKSGTKGPRSIIFLASLWWAWRHRNLMCLSNGTWSLTQLCINIQNSADIINNSFQPDGDNNQLDRIVRWNDNNHHGNVLNVDGSCSSTRTRTGFGGLIRNSAGFSPFGFSGFLANLTCILFTELTAIHEGLQLAMDMGLDELVCYSDSQLSINLITGVSSKYHTYAVLVQDIKDILACHNFTIHHTLREGNYCADFMAKLEASSNGDYLLHSSPPHDLLDLLRNDAMGAFFLRA